MSKLGWLTPDTDPGALVCFRFYVPSGDEWEAIARGALAPLMMSWNYEQNGSVTPADAAQAFVDANAETMKWRRCVNVGTIFWFAGSSTPVGCLDCDGTAYDTTDYPDLFAVIGTVFGSDGVGTFRVPDIARRSIVGRDPASGTPTRNLADVGGAETVTLTEDEIPAHLHTIPDHNHSVDAHAHSVHAHLTGLFVAPGEVPADIPNPVPSTTGNSSPGTSDDGAGDTSETGGDGDHENMHPFIVLRPVIQAV